MTRVEFRAGASLASVYGLRMLGLFFILPVLAVHAAKIRGGDDLALVGIALGVYGLAQGILQIPFGMASDRWGRKPVLYVGLLIFAAGSFLGIIADDIWTVIAARTLQGAGAISSVAMALAADLTREQHRTKIMAMIGSMIGFMFALSLVGAPVLYRWIDMAGLFALTGFLSLAAIWVVKTQVPDAPVRPRSTSAAQIPAAAGPIPMRAALLHPELLRLNAGIFILHVVLYAMFVVVPPMMVDAGLELSAHWKLYLPVVLLSFLVMIPPILYVDRRNAPKPVLIGAVVLLVVVEAAFGAMDKGLSTLAVLMLGFFISFNVLEALLPSLVSRIAPAEGRGVAIGVYNTTQTLGVALGGALGGWVAKHYGAAAVFGLCAALSVLWLVVVAGMRPVPLPASRAVNGLSNAAL